MRALKFFIVIFLFQTCSCSALTMDKSNDNYISYVTPYIKSGNIIGGQHNCSVKPMKDNIYSYAGFFTVKNNTQCISNLFFWFFPSKKSSSAPVVLWLGRNPDSSSFIGVFEESGPFYVKPKRGLKLRKYTFIESVSVIYMDNSVGTGFSYTNNNMCYPKNKNDVSADLLEAVNQFFKLFPEYQRNDFFISGESYACKYVSTLALDIDQNNNKTHSNIGRINLKGISIGNGFCDPQNMISYSNNFYQIGLIDRIGQSKFKTKEKEIISLIQNKNFVQAYNKFDMLINGHLIPFDKTLFFNITGFNNNQNYWFADNSTLHGDFIKFIESSIARNAIHVGNLQFNFDNKVFNFQLNDIMQSVKPSIETLLNKKYQVLIYSGQSDIIIPYTVTLDFVRKLNWSGSSEYLVADRQRFFVQTDLAGYFKKADNLIEVMIRDAGNEVFKDQPLWVLDMFTRFTSKDKPFY